MSRFEPQLPALIPRSLPAMWELMDPASFAWEIVRRLADYRSDGAARSQMVAGALGRVELIHTDGVAADAELLFR